jgi:type II secretory pathway predicted ATPase ExeA
MINKRTLAHFGLRTKGTFRSPLTETYEAEVEAAIEDAHMLAVVGEYGSGKTTLTRQVFRRLAADPASALELIEVVDPQREKVTIANVLNACIYHFGERPKREREARALQFIRLVGTAVVRQKRRVAVVIEDAHRLHHETFRALKDVRERSFLGVAPLFAVVLVGQGGLAERVKRFPEVFLRTNVVDLAEEDGWMSHAERVAYLEAVYAGAIAPAVRERVALLGRTPLALDHAVEQKMHEWFRAGLGGPLGEDAFPIGLRELREAVGASVRDIERASGVPKSTVQDALREGDTHPNAPDVRLGLQRLAAEARTHDAAPAAQAA